MPSEADTAAQRLLADLAELSLAVAEDLKAAIGATSDTRDMVRLANAFTKVGRCLRMSLALAARLARGEALAPAARNGRGLGADFSESDGWDEEEDDDWDEADGDEGLERESLFDRLPSGDPATQVASIARILTSASRALPAGHRHRTRCEALVAAARRDLPRRPPDPAGHGQPPPAPNVLAVAPNRSRDPPG